MEKLRKVFTTSGQSYGDLTLDLHCNRFGPTTLFQVYDTTCNLFYVVPVRTPYKPPLLHVYTRKAIKL